MNADRLDRGVMTSFAEALDGLVAEALSEAMKAYNRIFEQIGARLNFRVCFTDDDATALVWEVFGSSFLFKGIDGGVITFANIRKTSDLERVGGKKIEALLAPIVRLTRSPLNPKAILLTPERLVLLRAETGEVVGMMTNREKNFFIVTSKSEATERLTLWVKNREVSAGGAIVLRTAIRDSTLPPTPDLRVREINLPDGRRLRLSLDRDRIFDSQFLE